MSSRIRFVEIADANPNPSGSRDKQVIDLGDGSEVVYIPRFISRDQAWEWCEYLDKEIPWTRPSIHVFGRSCLQPRETCYIADEGLAAMRYSGYQPNAYSWDDYPILKDILKAVYEALPGSKFNTVLLNRYKSGSDYVAWHSDEDKLYGSTPEIASVSFGCEREFLLRKKPSKKPATISLCCNACASLQRCTSIKWETTQGQYRTACFCSKAWIFVTDERLHPTRLGSFGAQAHESRFC
ncbi:DNA oxidative demethylase ALKBH2-like isoform X2 [Musa acuminata AAA Group]|uniref:DNA oxidative demethylase ALKBH2-like isoform X2 n=1 Tax=Musa acuminata AAA Group TaxID=214697 RepID=UPI0031E3EC64